MSSFSFPTASNLVPRYVDAPLGPVDRLRSWLGYTIEANPLFGPPDKLLRMDSGKLIYGDNDDPVVLVDDPTRGVFTLDQSLLDGPDVLA